MKLCGAYVHAGEALLIMHLRDSKKRKADFHAPALDAHLGGHYHVASLRIVLHTSLCAEVLDACASAQGVCVLRA